MTPSNTATPAKMRFTQAMFVTNLIFNLENADRINDLSKSISDDKFYKNSSILDVRDVILPSIEDIDGEEVFCIKINRILSSEDDCIHIYSCLELADFTESKIDDHEYRYGALFQCIPEITHIKWRNLYCDREVLTLPDTDLNSIISKSYTHEGWKLKKVSIEDTEMVYDDIDEMLWDEDEELYDCQA